MSTSRRPIKVEYLDEIMTKSLISEDWSRHQIYTGDDWKGSPSQERSSIYHTVAIVAMKKAMDRSRSSLRALCQKTRRSCGIAWWKQKVYSHCHPIHRSNSKESIQTAAISEIDAKNDVDWFLVNETRKVIVGRWSLNDERWTIWTMNDEFSLWVVLRVIFYWYEITLLILTLEDI
jgi:hypothetical protein